MSIERQAEEVDIVKRNESGMITNPITLSPDQTTSDAEMILKTYKISGLPVVDSNKKLLGIITNRDLKYLKTDDTKVTKVMTKDNLVTGTIEWE